jgi:hypothetical protein
MFLSGIVATTTAILKFTQRAIWRYAAEAAFLLVIFMLARVYS